MSDEVELDSSKLGTLEYWDQEYETELENFNEFGDEGEIWFGVQSLKRIIHWLKSRLVDKSSHIIDIGCGNGYTCYKLAQEGFNNLFGCDYSSKAIELSKAICEKENLNVDFQVIDILDKNQYPTLKFDIAIDKGTYDAVGLCPDNPKEKRHLYRDFVSSILNENALFIICSCNWTTNELKDFFTLNKEFEYLDEIKAASNMTFAGSTGSTTSTVVFKFNKQEP